MRPPSDEQPSRSPRRWPRFTLRTLLIAMALVSVVAALAGGLLRSQAHKGIASSKVGFVLFSLLAPLAVLVLLGTLSAVGEIARRWKGRRS